MKRSGTADRERRSTLRCVDSSIPARRSLLVSGFEVSPVKKVDKKILAVSLFASVLLLVVLVVARASERSRRTHLPTSKALTLPVPGYLARTNSFPATIALSPDGRYAALLNNGYGTQETMSMQSIAVLDLKTNQLSDYPDKRFGEEVHQSYFLGLVFGSDGKHLYASVGSITDPTGQKAGDTGNGIAVYGFSDGKVRPERFIAVEPQALAA